MASIKRTATLAMLAAGFAATASHAVLSWTGCKDLADSNFTTVPIATRAKDTVAEPMKMAFDLLASKTEDAKGKVDVYFTERYGKIRKFDSKTGKVITLAKLNLNIGGVVSSDGALGIALDPAFKSNNFVYIYYSYITTAEKSWRVSRFTLNAAHDNLDLGSEVPIIKIPILGGSRHPGGAIQFDDHGNLYITTGNDYTVGHDYPTYSSPNTNDLRGKILRIHPEINPVNGKYYTIPTGNLFPEGMALTKPEIYIMGNRNPYTLSLDPVRHWVVWGDVGPDGVDMDGKAFNQNGTTDKIEEYDLATKPGNYGYPFFAGDVQTKSGINAAAPVVPAGSDWGFSGQGLTTLPPAIAPIYAYKRSCAVTGPITRYDGDLNSSIKFPPHLTRKWLASDFSGGNQKVQAFTLDDAGAKILAQEPIPGIALHGPLDIQYGPDGALYVINYGGQWRASEANTGLVRIEYTGDCHPPLPKLETSAILASQAQHQGLAAWQGPRVDINQASGFSVTVATSGSFTLEIRDLMGRPVASRSAQGPAPVSFNEVRNAGVYFLHVKTEEGSRVVKVVRN